MIEYNCRFGDPETQVVLPLLESDLLSIMMACTEGTLEKCDVRFSDKYAACVIMASEGYPAKYEKGYEITVPQQLWDDVFSAGTALKDGKLVTNGGRVLGVCAVSDTLSEALKDAYEKVSAISFQNAYYRHDIGRKALQAEGK